MNKAVQKELRAIASRLPIWFVDSHENHVMTGQEVLDETEFQEIEGKPIDLEKKYIIPMPVQVAYNHYRYLKKLYEKEGMASVQKYAAEVMIEGIQESIQESLLQ